MRFNHSDTSSSTRTPKIGHSSFCFRNYSSHPNFAILSIFLSLMGGNICFLRTRTVVALNIGYTNSIQKRRSVSSFSLGSSPSVITFSSTTSFLSQRKNIFEKENSVSKKESTTLHNTILPLYKRSSTSRLFSSSSSNSDYSTSAMKVSISDAFDGGNIEHVETILHDEDECALTVLLKIKPDPHTELEKLTHFQYFSFRSMVLPDLKAFFNSKDDIKECKVTYKIINAGEASYAVAWNGATTCYSTDRIQWRRVLNTSFDKDTGHLCFTFPHVLSQSVQFAYFPPYSYERHLDLISKCTNSPRATVVSLGQSLDGREMECVKVGTGPKTAWIIHRQHPGESMAEFYAEGLLERLLGLDSSTGCIDGLVSKACEKYTFYVVPNMCPDGSVRGHLRTNAIGSNLNREWAPSFIPGEGDEEDVPYDAPTLERSPEVYHILKAMDETGVDAFLDVHGDEELPYNFLAGAEGCPNWGDRLKYLQGAFLASYCRANSDMQIKIGYEPEEVGKGRMNVCSNQISTRFDCLGVTLEMPFKDCWSNKNPEVGWSPDRAKMLGKSVLDALVYVEPYLRVEGDFWNDGNKKWEEEDKYVAPTSKYLDS